MVKPWLIIVGMNERGWAALDKNLQHDIQSATRIFGNSRLLQQIPVPDDQKTTWQSPLSLSIDHILSLRSNPVVILSTGDPMWFGIGATLARYLTVSEMHVVPSVSAFSMVSARLAWPLHQTWCDTVHGRPVQRVRNLLAPNRRLILLGHHEKTPNEIAEILADMGYEHSILHIFEQMECSNEKHTTVFAKQLLENKYSFNPYHTIAIECQAKPNKPLIPNIIGIPDHFFVHHGKITKRETRLLTISSLRPGQGDCLWDVGAGTGSISIEWLRSGQQMTAYAIEHDKDQLVCLADNARFFGVENLHIIKGTAPDVLKDLPTPQAIFIGGGVQNPSMLEYCWERLSGGGRLVVNVVSLEGEVRLIEWQKKYGGNLMRLSIHHQEKMGELSGWRAMLPIMQYAHVKV